MADDALSLDFTLPGAITPEPEPAPMVAERVAEPPAPQTVVSSPPAPEPPKPASLPQPPTLPALPPLPASLSEAAVLHAEGKPLEAMRRLESALKSREPLGDNELTVWAALFDLLCLLGREPAFYSLAVAYTKRFERSPPMWKGCATTESAQAGSSDSGIALSGALDASIAGVLKQALALAQSRDVVCVDLGGLRSADANGAALLMRLISGLKKSKKRVQFTLPQTLAGLLQPLLVAGKREHEPAWLLLLELYQQAGMADPYEEVAINYAVTFEVSPPAWVTPESAPVDPVPSPASAEEERFSLSGTLTDISLARFQELPALQSADENIELDMRALVRIDVASAANLLTVVKGLVAAGKSVRLTGLAPLVAAFLRDRGYANVTTMHSRTF